MFVMSLRNVDCGGEMQPTRTPPRRSIKPYIAFFRNKSVPHTSSCLVRRKSKELIWVKPVYRCPSPLLCENQDRNRRFLHFAL